MAGSNQLRSEKTYNQQAPAGCVTLALPFPLQLAAGQSTDPGFLIAATTGVIDQIQTVFVDNADSIGTLLVTCNVTGQRVIVPGLSQAFIPLLVPNPPSLIFTARDADISATLQFMNQPMPLGVWAATSPANTKTGVSLTSRTTTTVGGASTQLMAANPLRQYLLIKSPQLDDVWINPRGGVAAPDGPDCFPILKGPYLYESSNKVFTGAITYYCATNGLTLTAFEG